MLTQDVEDLALHSEKIRTDAMNLGKWTTELAGEERERDSRATVESTWLKAVSVELASVKSKLTSSRVEDAISCWTVNSIVKGASKVDDDVNEAHTVVSGEVADATKRKVSIIGLELKDALKRVSTQDEIKSQAAISRRRAELERDDIEALRNVATCRAVLHDCVVKCSRILPKTTDEVVCFDDGNVFVEPSQNEKAKLNQTFEGGAGAGGTMDQN